MLLLASKKKFMLKTLDLSPFFSSRRCPFSHEEKKGICMKNEE